MAGKPTVGKVRRLKTKEQKEREAKAAKAKAKAKSKTKHKLPRGLNRNQRKLLIKSEENE
jgi:hypothetical protein